MAARQQELGPTNSFNAATRGIASMLDVLSGAMLVDLASQAPARQARVPLAAHRLTGLQALNSRRES